MVDDGLTFGINAEAATKRSTCPRPGETSRPAEPDCQPSRFLDRIALPATVPPSTGSTVPVT